ncbi:MAG: cephalosporin hydroxylase [Thaumarchaeota archaeon]|jgi:cephalosporin hydroxylase|nr:MAG: cephalosporin hydroxylase [Nitrososphaerota archaeon]
MFDEYEFDKKNQINIQAMAKKTSIKKATTEWFNKTYPYEYSYHFKWLGRPIIQYPQDIVALQEIIWKVKPDLIIETGIARGGSMIFSASMLELIGKGRVIGIDIDLRKHNKLAIKKHFLSKRITLLEGSSIDPLIVDKVYKLAKNKKKILVILDSNHSHNHVLEELKFYSPLVKKGSYLIVFDTVIDDMPKSILKNRSWRKNNSPKSAVKEFFKTNSRFTVDNEIENKLLITVAPYGYLKCIRS